MSSSLKLTSARRGFSLIELVVVVAIIGIIAVFAVPAASTIIRGSQLTQASQVMQDQISLARQYALTKNRPVEVRFYRFADIEAPGEDLEKPETGKFRAIQLFEIRETGEPSPLGKIHRMPVACMINSDLLSTLVDENGTGDQAPRKPNEKDPELPRGVKKQYEYCSFRFMPDGSTNLNPSKTWYTTVHQVTDIVRDKNTPPPNFFTLQIDPVSGTTKSYRPSAG